MSATQRSPAELRAADRAARERAVREFDQPVVLEAGAGTGKTTTLVARVVTWAAGPGWQAARERCAEDSADPQPERIARRVWSGLVMITFTEAAAAEMASRAGQALEALALGDLSAPSLTGVARDLLPPGPELEVRASALVEAVDQLQALTIHGYCARLLRAHALSSGLHPAFEIDGEQEHSEEVVREVVEGWLAELFGSGSRTNSVEAEASRALIRRGCGPETWVAAVLDGLSAGVDPAELEGDGAASWEAGVDELDADLIRAAEGLVAAVGPAFAGFKPSDKFACLLADVRALLEPGVDRERRIALAAELVEVRKGQLGDLIKQDAKDAVTEALGPEGLAPAAAAAETLREQAKQAGKLDRELHLAGRRVLRALLERARERRRQLGVLTYDDLLTESVRLLTHAQGGEVLARVRADLDQLLVDEFQDTSRVQCELVRLLAFGRGGDSAAVRGPGLFLVGDPKQSIYAFRGAELRAYRGFKDSLPGGEQVVSTLSVNYRSSQAVLDEVERLVEPCMEALPGLQPPFQPLIACESPGDATQLPATLGGTVDGAPGVRPVELWNAVGVEGPLSADAAVRLEAEAIAEDLLRLRDAGVELSDCAILLRSMPQVSVFVDALKRRGLPFTVGKDRSYFRRREVAEAVALLRCLVDPSDALSLTAFLRSSAVAVPDMALAALLRSGFAGQSVQLFGEGVAVDEAIRRWVSMARSAVERSPLFKEAGLDRLGDWSRSLDQGLRFLARWRERLGLLDVSRWLAGLRRELAFESGEATRFLGAYRAANLSRLFEELEHEVEARGGDLLGTARRLQRQLKGDRDRNDARPEGGGDPGVQLMSIHGSKGLGFRCVYLAQLQKGRNFSAGEAHGFQRTSSAVDGGWALKLFGSPSPQWCRTESEHALIEAAERVRLLYVALTRAKGRLVLSAGWTKDLKAQGWARADGLGHLIANRLRFDPVAPERTELPAAAGHECQGDAAGVLWKRYSQVAPEDAAVDDGHEIDLDRARSDAEQLASLAEQAAERRARPLVAAASSDVHAALDRQRVEQPDRWRDERGAAAIPERFGSTAAESARLAGTAIHQLLERWDGSAAALDLVHASLREELISLVAEAPAEACLARFDDLVERLRGSQLGARFAQLQDRIVARELPVIVPGEGPGSAGPTGAWTGSIDLVHTDGDAWVVVDYKSDAVDEAELDERAAVYRPQLERYGRALQGALGLPAAPRLELWFLHSDRRVVL